MVPLSHRDTITRGAKADLEMRGVYAFIFSEAFDFNSDKGFPHAALLRAVALKNVEAFQEQVADFQRRKISETSTWYDNDCLLFLLLLGCEYFEQERSFLESILAARDRNTNPIPRRVNEIYRALCRGEYGMDGQLAFIKIPFLSLSGKLKLTPAAAEKAYIELTQPDLLSQLSPFLQILALRAYDLVLFQRKPQLFEQYDELIVAIEQMKDKASVRDAFRLLAAMPYKWVIALLSIVLLALSFFFGLGQSAWACTHDAPTMRAYPKSLYVASASLAVNSRSNIIQALNLRIQSEFDVEKQATVIVLESNQFGERTPKFSVELSTNAGTIRKVYALLVQPNDGDWLETVLPVQMNAFGTRALLPPTDPESKIVFVAAIQLTQAADLDQIRALTSLRLLD